jgi:acylpyruvate hydrolase
MKLVTYLWQGQVAPGALISDWVVDLAGAFRAAFGPTENSRLPGDLLELLQRGEKSMVLAKQAIRFVAERQGRDLPESVVHSLAEVQLLAPICRPGKVVCVGLNYRSHLAEIGEPEPAFPILFLKPASSIIGTGQSIVLPRVSRQVDYEGELAVVIGRAGKYIPEEKALLHVAGFTCANDVSAHDIEFRTSQWTSGKMLDTFCPLGPVLQTRDEVPNPGLLNLKTTLNGETVQAATTSDMVFSVPFLISYISSLANLEPGDVILTGTPAGIGCNRKPQVFLRAGDRVSVQIGEIGTLTNSVIAEDPEEC